MAAKDLPERLSKISTVWNLVREAHAGGTAATAAQTLLLERYGGAIQRYLLAILRDPSAADEVRQEFALVLVKGGLGGADPERGRFRNYVKAVLSHLVSQYRKKQSRSPRPIPPDAPCLAALAVSPEDEDKRRFQQSWREALLARTWDALADAHATGHAVLRFRAANPTMPAADMAPQLSAQLGKPFTADGVRQALRRAREKFAELLLEEVAHSLEKPTLDEVQEELSELNLLDYCRPVLERRRGTATE